MLCKQGSACVPSPSIPLVLVFTRAWWSLSATGCSPHHTATQCLTSLAACTGVCLQTLYRLKAELEGLPLEAVAPQPTATATSMSEDTLLPLIGAPSCCLLLRC